MLKKHYLHHENNVFVFDETFHAFFSTFFFHLTCLEPIWLTLIASVASVQLWINTH